MRRNWTIGLALVGCTAVSALVVLLAKRVVDLSEAYSELKARNSLPYPGYIVPTIQARTLSGDSIEVGRLPAVGGRQVVFVFTTSCPYCRATLPVWDLVFDSLARQPSNGVNVVGMSLDSTTLTSTYAAEHRIRYPIAFFPDWKAPRLFRAQMVPQTLVLSHLGEVLYAHVGQLDRGPGLDSLFRSLTLTVRPAQTARGQ